ncbi:MULTISPECIES: type II toxin-antitoxin system RelE/ParE family toxin [unclassified Microcystis]|uniref:Type II toxin-antitoxin system RelE/ParE family toxin n=1 Tax=Microcystis aeruginosa Ma_QC_Ca_00000000_S207 TaxID=2486251 RepID=A0A552FFS4_MICAE|nr:MULTISPECIES: type II toxin-antitoxin system RelE/ParE family toxin [unclassified Microcystis]MCA2925673.1 type II toxin-antitoxin system RelE/ParE family toxin [Microcystis sp. M020S1]MCA2935008.1 type II toxin-antitoxin system RelE/ParE family toxin [Microcystis sp. M015S1]TRU45579.1 MAG: type II toxin-antitoxin system RelE/ParE family toxin [Microcystis aeruginosa Ma_QC_Ca_00000000_S207]MCA2622039.1 type II toxin-antitoxin system RelE/ParE family toxin [Microcystis sp. M099S2]MCA2649599.
MDYKVILSPQAIRDLETIVRYVAITNPELAKKLGQQLLDKTKDLGFFPFRGRLETLISAKRISVVHEPIHQVSVARFWHTARGFLE